MALAIFFILLAGLLIIFTPVVFYLSFSLVCIVISIIILYFFLNIKTFEYDNSILYISIKQTYFWKFNRMIPPIEFPNDRLTSFRIKKGMFTTSLILFLDSEGRKTKTIYCEITGLNKAQIFELKQSFQNAVDYPGI